MIEHSAGVPGSTSEMKYTACRGTAPCKMGYRNRFELKNDLFGFRRTKE